MEARVQMAAIDVKNLRKAYGAVTVVDAVTFSVDHGEVFALLGPNGAGKTTTVEILEGHRSADSGEVRVLGYDPRSNQKRFRERIGIVLQEAGLEEDFTVTELLKWQRRLYPRRLAVDDLIDQVGLSEKRNARVKTLSGGQRRRLDLALGLAGDPEVLFLDEPTTGFDPAARRQAWALVEALRGRGKTVLLTTHYLDEAEHLADRVAVMVRGRLVALGTPAELTAHQREVVIATMPPIAISVAEAREKRILKRVRGTPLPAWCYFSGQVGAACVFAIASLVVTLLVSVTLYGVRLQGVTLLATTVTVILGIASFSAVGLAIGSLSRSAAIAEAVAIGAAVVLSFISGLFLVGARLPTWLSQLAWAFPLKPYAVLLQDQFNPYVEASWDLAALAVIAAWGVLGTLVSLRAFRWERHRPAKAARLPEGLLGTSIVQTSAPIITARRPSSVALIGLSATAAVRVVTRRPGDVFFSLAMPIGLFALLVTVQPNDTLPNGQSVALATAASMVTWGAGVAVFMNLAESVARARDVRLLKRLRSTPLPASDYLVGKAIAALAIVVVLLIGILALGAIAYQLQISPTGLAVGAVVVVVGTGSLAACGFLLAAVVPTARAVGAVGLILLFVLSFFSDVFINAGPEWMGVVGSLFPLKHFQNGLATAWASDGTDMPWFNILVLAVWGAVAAALAVRLFRWEPASS